MKSAASAICVLAVALQAPLPAWAEAVRSAQPLQPPEPVTAGTLLQVVFGLAVILALIVGGAMLLRRFGQWNLTQGGALRIVAGLAIGPRERVVVLQVGSQQLLVGITPGSIATLAELKEPLPLTTAAEGQISFRERLQAMLQSGREKSD